MKELRKMQDALVKLGTIDPLQAIEDARATCQNSTGLRPYQEESVREFGERYGAGRRVAIMTGSNMGKTTVTREMVRRLAGDYNREEIDAAVLENISRTVTGRIPSRGPGMVTPGTYREIDCSHLAPWGMTRSRYQLEAIQNGDLAIMKGTSVGMSWAAPTYAVNVCDVCGCVHRSHHGYICNSCFDAIARVEMEQAAERRRAWQRALIRSFNDAHTGIMEIPEDAPFYGPSPLQAFGRAFRPVGWVRDAPVYIFHDECDARMFSIDHLAKSIATAIGVPLEALLRPYDPPAERPIASLSRALEKLTSIGLSAGNGFSDFFSEYAMSCPQHTEPVMKRNKRNRGPKKHGKWWQQ